MTEHPDNQADGFKGDASDMPKAAFNAPAARGGSGPDNDFWNSLQQAAALKQWHKLQRLLDDHKTIHTPLNPVTLQVFQRAAQEGQVAIVSELFRRGFALLPEESGDTLKNLVQHHAPAAMPVADFLIRHKHAPAHDAILYLAEHGTPQQMQQLKDAGADVNASGGSFPAAFYAGNMPMMSFLLRVEADIFRASIVAGLHGRRESYLARFGGPPTDEVAAHYKNLLKQDASNWELYYAYVCPNHPTLDDMRQVPFGVKEQGMTLMHLAARTGCFADIVTAADKADGGYLTAADLLLQDKNGVSVLLILASRGEEQALFDVRLWHNNPAGLREINEALKDMSAGHPIPPAMDLELQLYHLRKKADPRRWSLKPGLK